MKFYNRQAEIQELSAIYSQSESESRMTVITGRRRVGKTTLALEFCRETRFVYLFVSRKAEHLLCILYQVDGATVRIYAVGAHDVAYRKAKSRK